MSFVLKWVKMKIIKICQFQKYEYFMFYLNEDCGMCVYHIEVERWAIWMEEQFPQRLHKL